MCFGGGGDKGGDSSQFRAGTRPAAAPEAPERAGWQSTTKPTAGAQSMGLTVDDPNKKSVLGSY